METDVDGVKRELGNGSRVLMMVRHAERMRIDNNDPTFGETLPLTDEGVRTSIRLGEMLKEYAGDVQFLSSPLKRTQMTAAGIAEGMGLSGIKIETDARLGNDSFYFADQYRVFELFRDGSFFAKLFEYMENGKLDGFRDPAIASDELEDWALNRFTARLGIFTTHDLYNAVFLHTRGAKRDWTRENWLRFLDAAAIIINNDGSRKYALVRAGLSEGVCGVVPREA